MGKSERDRQVIEKSERETGEWVMEKSKRQASEGEPGDKLRDRRVMEKSKRRRVMRERWMTHTLHNTHQTHTTICIQQISFVRALPT